MPDDDNHPCQYPGCTNLADVKRVDRAGHEDRTYLCATHYLVCTAVEEVAMYFAQRKPNELGSFTWTIDAKDHTKITKQENWWKLTLGPLIETGSESEPFLIGAGPEFDYSHFDHSFQFEHQLWRPGRERVKIRGLNIKRMLLENLSFVDSRSDILVQAVDALVGALRRVLRRTSTDLLPRAYQLGRLQISRKRGRVVQAVQFFSLSNGRLSVPRVMDVIREMAKAHRSMILRKR